MIMKSQVLIDFVVEFVIVLKVSNINELDFKDDCVGCLKLKVDGGITKRVWCESSVGLTKRTESNLATQLKSLNTISETKCKTLLVSLHLVAKMGT